MTNDPIDFQSYLDRPKRTETEARYHLTAKGREQLAGKETMTHLQELFVLTTELVRIRRRLTELNLYFKEKNND